MKQCLRCDRQYPDTENFCEMDGAYLLRTDELDELPPRVCPACTGLSPGISIDGETIMHCPVCQDTGKVTVEEADRWREEMRKRHGKAADEQS
jgi:hypothetical protein